MYQLYALRRLMQGPEESPKAPLGNNARPVQNLHHRTVRTNIDFKQSKVNDIFYQAKKKRSFNFIFIEHFATLCKSITDMQSMSSIKYAAFQ